MGSYIDKIKAANPTAYSKLSDLMAYSANEGNNGIPQDWQAQIFTPLQAEAPKKIETGKYVDVPEYATDAENSPYQTGRTVKQWVQSAPEGYTPTVVEVGGDTTQYATTGYTKDLGKINGLPVMAQYDLEGNLTGYASDPRYRNWLSGSTGVSGQWDASGMPKPAQHVSGGGGFFGNALGDITGAIGSIWNDLPPLGKLAAAYYGGTAIAESLGAPALTGTDAAMADLAASTPAFSGATPTAFAGALPEGFSSTLPVPGPPVQVASTLPGAGLESLSPAVEGMGGAQGLKASQGLGTNLAASSGNLAEMGAAQGLGGGTTLSGLAEMGGAQGLVAGATALPLIGAMDAGTNLAAGEVLGAAGAGGALTPAAAGIGAGLGLSQAATGAGSALAGTAAGSALSSAAGAAGGAAAGNALSDILPYTTGASLLGGYLQADAAKEAAQIQADAANKAMAQQQANFELINRQQAPYRAAGYNTLNEIAKLSSGQTPQYDYQGNIVKDAAGNPVMQAGSGYLTNQFSPQDFAAGIDPGYAFRLQQGQMANQRAANVAGGALSGNTLKGLQDYTQGLASTEYGNAFDRYQKQRQNIYNTLASIAGIGQTGQTATNTAATNATNAATQLGIGSAAAQAAGNVGATQAYTNAINNATNNYTLASLLNQRGNVVA